MLNVAAEYSLEMLTADIKGAYLIPDIVEGTSPDVWIEKSLSVMFVEMYPNLKEYVCDNGKLIFKLQKYLYGLPQAAFHFHQHLSERMKEHGFTQLTSDRCFWRRGSGDMCIYVMCTISWQLGNRAY
jgi:hypothetical protein